MARRYPHDDGPAECGETASPGRSGLFTNGACAAFDGVVYTRGWDEWGEQITAWQSKTGNWRSNAEGLAATTSDAAQAFKGDALDAYEFSVQIEPGTGRAGVYAVWVDEQDFLRVDAGASFAEITASGKRDGVPIGPTTVPVVRPTGHRPPQNAVGHNLRIIKASHGVRVFVDGCEQLAVPGRWPASRVGLHAEGSASRFDGISLHERPRE